MRVIPILAATILILGVGLEQHDALGVLVAEQGQGVVGGVLQIAEGDDVAVGLDRIEDAVGARIGLDQPVGPTADDSPAKRAAEKTLVADC